jgi:hypothetical protein
LVIRSQRPLSAYAQFRRDHATVRISQESPANAQHQYMSLDFKKDWIWKKVPITYFTQLWP